MIWTALLSLLSGIPGMLGDYFKKKQEIEVTRLDTQLQIELANKTMAAEIAKAEFQKSQTIVRATGQYFKYFTFTMWFGPYMVGILFPSYAKDIFTNLATMPEWYVQSCMTIIFTVWGITVSAPVVGNIFENLGKFFANRRDYKLAKLTLVNRKAYYEAIRHAKGSVSEQDVRIMEPIFDQIDKDAQSGQ